MVKGMPPDNGATGVARSPEMTTTTITRPTLTPLLLALLALLSAFTPLSIDMYLPALPVIAVDLRGTVGDIQLTQHARHWLRGDIAEPRLKEQR